MSCCVNYREKTGILLGKQVTLVFSKWKYLNIECTDFIALSGNLCWQIASNKKECTCSRRLLLSTHNIFSSTVQLLWWLRLWGGCNQHESFESTIDCYDRLVYSFVISNNIWGRADKRALYLYQWGTSKSVHYGFEHDSHCLREISIWPPWELKVPGLQR